MLLTLERIGLKKISGISPVISVPIINGKKAINSLLFISTNTLQNLSFKLPKEILLNSHNE